MLCDAEVNVLDISALQMSVSNREEYYFADRIQNTDVLPSNLAGRGVSPRQYVGVN